MIGALAVAAIAATALALVHDLDATVMILLWNFGTAAVFLAIAGGVGRRILVWPAPAASLASRPRLAAIK